VSNRQSTTIVRFEPPLERVHSPSVPLVSVGVPVFNGQKYIAAALDSLLAQTLSNLEIIVCDNNSTDDTQRICLQYAACDPRVRYFRNERNLGPAENHNRCFAFARGTYFKWHAYDDLCDPTFLEKCVAVLEHDPSVVNCHTFTRVISEDGQLIRNYDFRTGTDSPIASHRFGNLFNVKHRLHAGYEIFGVWRRDQLAQTPLEKPDAHGDRILLVRMCLRGRFHEVPEFLFSSRAHANQSMQAKPRRGRLSRWVGTGPMPPAEWWDASKQGKMVFPEWKLVAEYWAAIGEVKTLSRADRLRSRLWVVAWVVRHWYKLVRDLLLAAEHAVLNFSNKQDETRVATPAGPLGAPGPHPRKTPALIRG